MTVFVDTSALLPLLDSSDGDHHAVVASLDALAKQDATLVTTSYTLIESGALAKRRLGASAFVQLGRVAKKAFDIVWVDEDLHDEAWKIAASHGRKGLSLVDCVAFLVMRSRGIERALTLDGHFRTEGFETIP